MVKATAPTITTNVLVARAITLAMMLAIRSLKLRARGLITEATILVAGDITLAIVAPYSVVEDIVQATIPIV